MTKIMLVEDDKSLREIYGVRLLAEGYDIISAGDGEEALAMAIKDRPSLIVSDVMMPKISGFDMLDILRSTTETKNIKVIMMTALSSEEQRQRGEQLGADKYLVKSQVGIEDVVKAVHEVLQDTPNTNDSSLNPPRAQAAPPQAPPENSLQTAAPASTIPEPSAPFTGNRPATLGERIVQPLKDNPRIDKVDMSELLNKEFAANIDSVENNPDTSEPNPPPAPQPPAAANAATYMNPPVAPQPAAEPQTLSQSPPPAAYYPAVPSTPATSYANPAAAPAVAQPSQAPAAAPPPPPSDQFAAATQQAQPTPQTPASNPYVDQSQQSPAAPINPPQRPN